MSSFYGTLVRQEIKDLVPYTPGSSTGSIKLDANESPFEFPDEIRNEIFSLINSDHFTRYPDAMASELVNELACCYGISPAQVMVGNGSDELILNLMLAFGSGNRVVIAVPTFSMYGIHARVAGARIVEVPRGRDFELIADEMVRAGRDAGLVVICSPNNPSGNSSSREEIAFILRNCRCPVVVDQAYVEFGGIDMLPLLAEHDNLVILRTFSKAYGMAGLRIGYLFTSPGILHYLLKVKQPFNLNNFSQVAALSAIRNRKIFERQIAIIIDEREKLYEEMSKIPGVRVFPSDTNYLLFSTAVPAAEVFRGMVAEKVLIRNFSEPLLSGHLRVTVGKPEENIIFLSALRKVIHALEEKKND